MITPWAYAVMIGVSAAVYGCLDLLRYWSRRPAEEERERRRLEERRAQHLSGELEAQRDATTGAIRVLGDRLRDAEQRAAFQRSTAITLAQCLVVLSEDPRASAWAQEQARLVLARVGGPSAAG